VDTSSVAHSGRHPRPDTHDETPPGCYDGWVYMGFEGEDESGEYVELVERVLCRRCNAAAELL
jgi:hypothetical protein